jgi:beta-N-acetylhexosaminidase
MNFAPTVDIYTNRASTVIGPRSFGSDPVRAGLLGTAFMKGQQAAGVIATAKHYPGHGDTDLDSHGVLPRIAVPFETLWERELVPYRMLAKERIPAIMTGHLAFPNTRAESSPASLSSWFLRDILRDRIGFQGLIITDDLMMNGATAWAGSLSQAAKLALLSGNDIIMLSKTPNLADPVWTSLLASMRREPAFRERVRDAARRIIETKLEYLRGENAAPYMPDLRKVAAGLPDPEGSRFFLDLAARSVTVLGENRDVFPLTREKAGNVLLAGQYLDFFSAGRTAYPGARGYWYTPEPESIATLLDMARRSDTILFCLSDSEGLGVLRNLRGLGKRVIVFSVLSPVYLDQVPWIDGALAVYSYAPESFIAGFSFMLGRIGAQGQLPLQAPAGPQG